MEDGPASPCILALSQTSRQHAAGICEHKRSERRLLGCSHESCSPAALMAGEHGYASHSMATL